MSRKNAPGKYRVHIPREIDVRAIRSKLDMTLEEFAQTFRFSTDSLRHWGQDKRVREKHMRAYLTVIDRASNVAQKALKSAA